MEGEEEYLETDVRKVILHNLKHLGLDGEFVDNLDIERPPYYSGLFAGGVFRMVDNIGTLSVKARNFDCIHILRRG